MWKSYMYITDADRMTRWTSKHAFTKKDGSTLKSAEVYVN